jgi:hypothetical protein
MTALLLFGLGLAIVSESMGWPFLQAPLQRFLSNTLQREVSFAAPADTVEPAGGAFRVHLWGGIELRLAYLRVAAPAWSSAPHLLAASDVALQLSYADLWRAHQGQTFHINRLQAATLDAQLERLPDGRASWQFGKPAPDATVMAAPSVGNLRVGAGVVRYRDEPRAIHVLVHLSLTDAQTLQANANGSYRGLPVKVALTTTGALPWVADEATAVASAAPLTLSASVGRATLAFQGTARDARHLSNLTGRFVITGPSLAAVGDPVGVTLPTTAAFRAEGRVVKQGDLWNVVADHVAVGSSRLNGAFTYDRGRAVPLLAGRLGGSKLLLADLGPAVGAAPRTASGAYQPASTTTTATATAPAGAASAAAKMVLAKGTPPKQVKGPGKVLPSRPFDLGALRKMDADVLVDVAELDLNTTVLEPLRPVRTHLLLSAGVLTLADLDARTAQGKLQGDVRLDGTGAQALWQAKLRWSGVRLERWLHQQRAPGVPPYITGELNGRAVVDGQGRSTADILGSLNGQVHSELRGGTVSHLLVETAGLDLAQGLGMLVKGDDALPVLCGVTDLVAQNGQFRPRVMVLDTTDSTIWIDGSLSLATEAMDLRAVVSPKDFSPLSLRTPLLLRGSFAHPDVSVQKAPLGRKLGGALLLGLLNPLASLLAFVDPGDASAAGHDAEGCKALVQKSVASGTALSRH